MLSRLKDFEIDRGVRRLAYSGKAHVPSLPEFTKLCRMVGDDSVDEGPQRLALPSPDTFVGDQWDLIANQRLLKFITTTVSAKSNALGEVPEMQVERAPNGKPLRLKSVPSAQQVIATGILTGYKKAWAQDMREASVDPNTGEVLRVPVTEQENSWNECMRRAMAEVDQRIAS